MEMSGRTIRSRLVVVELLVAGLHSSSEKGMRLDVKCARDFGDYCELLVKFWSWLEGLRSQRSWPTFELLCVFAWVWRLRYVVCCVCR